LAVGIDGFGDEGHLAVVVDPSDAELPRRIGGGRDDAAAYVVLESRKCRYRNLVQREVVVVLRLSLKYVV
jgi:hypothetical protein